MRKAFIKTLCEVAKEDKRIMLLTGDLGYSILEEFRDQFPDRFLNIGVAEANLMTVAAGLSTTGYIPFVYSIATFATIRPFEQIRNDISWQNLNVKIVGVGAGFAYSKAGFTHHALEDISLMRMLPNMSITAPATFKQMADATRTAVSHVGPMYLRIERNPTEIDEQSEKPFVFGKGICISKGKTIALLTTGTKISFVLRLKDLLKKQGHNPSIFVFPTVRPLDTELIKEIARGYSYIATVEEHYIEGGFGMEVMNLITSLSSFPNNIKKIFRFGPSRDTITPYSGEYENVLKKYHFTPEAISKEIIECLSVTVKKPVSSGGHV